MANVINISVENARAGGPSQGQENGGQSCDDQWIFHFRTQTGCKQLKGLVDESSENAGSNCPVGNGCLICDGPGTCSCDLSQISCQFKGGGSSYPATFFPSFLDNLGSQYLPDCPGDERSEKASEISPASSQAPTEVQEFESRPLGEADGNAIQVVVVFTEEPKPETLLMTTHADVAEKSTDSSTRGVDDLIREFSESDENGDELTSRHQPTVLTTFVIPSDQVFPPSMSSKVNGDLVGSTNADESTSGNSLTEFQFHSPWEHVSSMWNTQDCWHPASPQEPSCELSLRDLDGERRAPEDGWDWYPSWSSTLSRKRLRPDDTERLVPVTIALPILESRFRDPSWQRDFDEVICHDLAVDITGDFDLFRRYEEQCEKAARRAEEHSRMRMLTLPEESFRNTNEAMHRTLITFQEWQFSLGLHNPTCPTVASEIFYRGFRNFQTSAWAAWPIEICKTRLLVKVLLAAAFWVTSKIIYDPKNIPSASQMARAAGIHVQSLTGAELALLDALHWELWLVSWLSE